MAPEEFVNAVCEMLVTIGYDPHYWDWSMNGNRYYLISLDGIQIRVNDNSTISVGVKLVGFDYTGGTVLDLADPNSFTEERLSAAIKAHL